MVNISIFESTDFLKARLISIIKESGFMCNEISESNMLSNSRIIKLFDKSNLIIFDLDNKGYDILGIVSRLKKDESTCNIPIIVLSSQSDYKHLKSAIGAGCSDFITKPFSREKFLEKIYKNAINVPYELIEEPTPNSREEYYRTISDEQLEFRWDKDFELGIEEIDYEHGQIVERFDKLYNYMKEGRGHEYYIEILEFLNDYVNTHFRNEEKLQRKIGYDLIAQHQIIHYEFKEKVKKIIEESKDKEISNLELIRLNLFIKDWLINHILIEDRKIADFIEKNNKNIN